eukprot:70532_1
MALRKLFKFIANRQVSSTLDENVLEKENTTMESMEELYNSLLILHTHTFRINKKTSSPIIPNSHDQFVVYKKLSLDVRCSVNKAMFVLRGRETMWKTRETMLSHFQSINNRKRNEVIIIVRFWLNGCRMKWDKNVGTLITMYIDLLDITDPNELLRLLGKYLGATVQ